MIRTWTPVAPLLAAVLAPFSVLFDIPALTEPWFVRADPDVLLDPNKANSIPDHTVSLALSGIGLGFNIVANALLIVRFSTTAQWWRIATRLSLVFWVSKVRRMFSSVFYKHTETLRPAQVIIALVNLCVFGRVDSATRRGEGLWCA
jgi:potassium channel subfamily K